MMKFRRVKKALNDLLGGASAGRFHVVGYERQGVDAQQVKNMDRIVQAFYSHGDFRKSAGSLTGPKLHDINFGIGLFVSAPARVDLSVINKEGATQGQIEGALAAMQEGSYVADELFDELAETVWNILTDGRNRDLGLKIGTVSNNWVESIRKDAPVPRGALVVLTGEIHFTLSTSEDVTGDIGVQVVRTAFDVTLDLPGDTVQKTGVSVS